MPLTQAQIAAFRTALEQERDAIASASTGTAQDRAPVELDQQSVGRLSRMDAMQMQAMAKAQEIRRKARLPLIAAALKRMDEDEFGYCTACGEDIPPGRLSIDPASPRCVGCAG